MTERISVTISDREIIGRALVSYVTQQAMQVDALGPDMVKYCAENGDDPAAVLDRELAVLRRFYDVMVTYTPVPLPWAMYESMARQGWKGTE
jgi:hypothetical protein